MKGGHAETTNPGRPEEESTAELTNPGEHIELTDPRIPTVEFHISFEAHVPSRAQQEVYRQHAIQYAPKRTARIQLSVTPHLMDDGTPGFRTSMQYYNVNNICLDELVMDTEDPPQ